MQTSDPQYGTTATNTMPKRDSALKIGLIMGLVAFLTYLVFDFIFDAVGAPGFGDIFSIGSFITIMMIAGAIAGRRFASPALTGLVAGLVAGILGPIAGAIRGVPSTDLSALQRQAGLSQDETQAVVGAAIVVAILLSALFGLAFGALFGWLGGKLFGKGRDATTYRT